MRRDVQAIVLVLVGGVILRIALSGTYTNYVRPGLGWPLTVTGGLLVGLGLWSAFRDGLIRGDERTLAEDDDGHGHSHGTHGPRIAWLLLLPVFTIFLVAPPALGSYAADLDSVSVTEPEDGAIPALPDGDPVDVLVSDYAIRAVWDEGKTLEGRRVRLTGFVTPRPDGTWDVTKLQLQCCAADARPYRVQAVGAEPLPADTWVEVTGTWTPGGGVRVDDAVPLLDVDSVVVIDQPAEPYE